MLTSKQRAQLRSLASNMDVIMQVGKSGVTEPMAKTVSDALEARELIKMRVLENSGEEVRDVAEQLAAATDSEVVAVIGKCLILYRESETKKRSELC
jgi:RNA-binding protein